VFERTVAGPARRLVVERTRDWPVRGLLFERTNGWLVRRLLFERTIDWPVLRLMPERALTRPMRMPVFELMLLLRKLRLRRRLRRFPTRRPRVRLVPDRITVPPGLIVVTAVGAVRVAVA
jgi:hypothetical protein